MCEEESDDAEAVAKLLEINDSIHRTIERYKLMKAGNVEAANKIAKGTLGTTTGVGKNAANELSLIDFDLDPPTEAPQQASTSNGSLLDAEPSSSNAQAKPTTVEDDLLGLDLNGPGSRSLGTGPISLAMSMGGGQAGSTLSNTSSMHFQPPPPQSNYDALASFSRPSNSVSPAPMAQQPPAPPSQAPKDPFRDLFSASPRPSTPSKQAAPSHAVSQDLFQSTGDPLQEGMGPFQSSAPEQQSAKTKVLSSAVVIEFESRRLPAQPHIAITARYSNSTQQHITDLKFHLAIERSYSFEMTPQSGKEIRPQSNDSIQQKILLKGVPMGKGNVVRMRFKVEYKLNGQQQEQQGDVPPLGIE